jgi:predicted transposase YbfD/YdcC
MEKLSELEDPRQRSNGTRHDFREILVIAVCAMLSDADSFEDIALWGRLKADWLRRFLVLKNGIPSQDTFLRVFRVLDRSSLKRCSDAGWAGSSAHLMACSPSTARRYAVRPTVTPHRCTWSAPSRPSSDWYSARRKSRQEQRDHRHPELLEALHIKGLLVSIDAMGCQREIAAKIVEKGAITCSRSRATSPRCTSRCAISSAMLNSPATASSMWINPTAGRCCSSAGSPPAAEIDPELWPGCKTVGCVVSQRVVGDKVAELEERYYISSRPSAPKSWPRPCAHWAIENRLHWMLDVCFGEDDCMIRKDNAPQNLSLLKKIVLNLIRADKTDTAKTSLRLKRKRAAWDDDIRMKMLGIHPL